VRAQPLQGKFTGVAGVLQVEVHRERDQRRILGAPGFRPGAQQQVRPWPHRQCGQPGIDALDIGIELRASAEEIERALRIVQNLDPAGVGARDLKECLALQLRELDRLDPAMQALLELLDACKLVMWKNSLLSVPKKLSMAALSRQLPLRDMLWVSPWAISWRR
jgi:hypothetical protein